MNRRKLVIGIAGIVTVGITAAVVLQPASAIPVFDASNYAENVLQAARSLEQINNQIRSLQNQATMIQSMAKNLQKLDVSHVSEMTGALQRVDALMQQAQGISFNLNTTNASFHQLYPQQYAAAVTTDEMVQDARRRWEESMNSYQHTMSVQSQVVENVQGDRDLLERLVNESQGAEGSLQAQQATNQLLALSTKQQLQIQTMMAAQFRAQAAEQARLIQSQEQGRAATKRFLGNSNF